MVDAQLEKKDVVEVKNELKTTKDMQKIHQEHIADLDEIMRDVVDHFDKIERKLVIEEAQLELNDDETASQKILIERIKANSRVARSEGASTSTQLN